MTDVKVTVSADGKKEQEICDILKVVMVKSADTPCVYFECTVHEPMLMSNVNYVNCYVNGNAVFSGIVDKRIHSASREGSVTNIFARSTVGALLLDNEAMPRVYNYPRLSTIAAIHGYPYGIKGIDTQSDRGLPFFTVVKGISEWDVISLYVRQAYGFLPYINEKGYLVAKKRHKNSALVISNQSEDGLAYMSVNITDNPHKKLSHVYICKDDGSYTLVNNNEAGTVRRRRFHVPSSQWVLFPRWSVNEIISQSMTDSFHAEIELFGHVELDLGSDILLPDFYSSDELFEVTKVEHSFFDKVVTKVSLGKSEAQSR